MSEIDALETMTDEEERLIESIYHPLKHFDYERDLAIYFSKMETYKLSDKNIKLKDIIRDIKLAKKSTENNKISRAVMDYSYLKDQMYLYYENSKLDSAKSKAYKKYKREQHFSHFEMLEYSLGGDITKYEYMGGFKKTDNKKPDEYMSLMLLRGYKYPREYEEDCMCTHPIVKQCYIRNIETGEFYVVGSDCIDKFKINRECLTCGVKHANKSGRCKPCSTLKGNFTKKINKILNQKYSEYIEQFKKDRKKLLEQKKQRCLHLIKLKLEKDLNDEKQRIYDLKRQTMRQKYRYKNVENVEEHVDAVLSIVQFGKFAGKHLYVLLDDRSYVNWIVREWMKKGPCPAFKPIIEYLKKYENLVVV